MTLSSPNGSAARRPLRLWPGAIAGALLLVLWFGVPIVAPEQAMVGFFGGLLCAAAVLVWWLFFSRAPRLERWGAVPLMIVALAVTPPLLHESIRGGMMGAMFYIYATPALCLALAAWAVACHRLADLPRRAALAAFILLTCGVFAVLRTDGILGGGGAQFAWRWTPTAEEKLLARAGEPGAATAGSTTPDAASPDAAESGVVETGATEAGSPGGTAPSSEGRARSSAGSQGGEAPNVEIALNPKQSGELTSLNEAVSGDSTSDLESSQAPGTQRDWPGFRGPNRDSVVHGIRFETDWSKQPTR